VVCDKYGIGGGGEYCGGNEAQLHRINMFYHEASGGKYVPRAFLDFTTPIRRSASYSVLETSKTKTRARAKTWRTSPQPSRHVRRSGAAPLSGAEEQTARAVSVFWQYACSLSSQLGNINKTTWPKV
jgi:hypothetical protein